MSVDFQDNSAQVIAELERRKREFLESCGKQLEASAKATVRVRTGRTSASYSHVVQGDECIVGSNEDNAIYEEYGTGIYADQEGGGTRAKRIPWVYYDEEAGQWYMTSGKSATRPLRTAIDDLDVDGTIIKTFGGD